MSVSVSVSVSAPDLLDMSRRTVLGDAPLPFFAAIFDSCCIQRPMFADATALARELETEQDGATSACESRELHPFLSRY